MMQAYVDRHHTMSGSTPAVAPTSASSTTRLTCRFCGIELRRTFVDLGMSPLCESFLTAQQLDQMEPFYPLHVRICENCMLVQLPEYVAPEAIFTDYAYFSSYSDSWVAHARRYVESMIARLSLGPNSFVVELASNDGYLLQHFVDRGVPVLGVEPARNVAAYAVARGIPTVTEFFGEAAALRLVANHGPADLLIGNNVFAHVPALNDFSEGLHTLLAPDGVLTLEFPHLVRLIEGNQLDTIYHEHFSYFTFGTAHRVLAAHDLTVFDVEELSTHGGSLRIFARRADATDREISPAVGRLLDGERAAGYDRLETYRSFGDGVASIKGGLLRFLIDAKERGKTVAGYGAPGKGNTLLNYCGIREDLLAYTVDRNPHKHGMFLPGTHIPIFPVERIAETRPDYVLLLPWNLREELAGQLAHVREWGGRLVVPIPTVEMLP
jgi:SAM-dependent methyltransferase